MGWCRASTLSPIPLRRERVALTLEVILVPRVAVAPSAEARMVTARSVQMALVQDHGKAISKNLGATGSSPASWSMARMRRLFTVHQASSPIEGAMLSVDNALKV